MNDQSQDSFSGFIDSLEEGKVSKSRLFWKAYSSAAEREDALAIALVRLAANSLSLEACKDVLEKRELSDSTAYSLEWCFEDTCAVFSALQKLIAHRVFLVTVQFRLERERDSNHHQ